MESGDGGADDGCGEHSQQMEEPQHPPEEQQQEQVDKESEEAENLRHQQLQQLHQQLQEIQRQQQQQEEQQEKQQQQHLPESDQGSSVDAEVAAVDVKHEDGIDNEGGDNNDVNSNDDKADNMDNVDESKREDPDKVTEGDEDVIAAAATAEGTDADNSEEAGRDDNDVEKSAADVDESAAESFKSLESTHGEAESVPSLPETGKIQGEEDDVSASLPATGSLLEASGQEEEQEKDPTKPCGDSLEDGSLKDSDGGENENPDSKSKDADGTVDEGNHAGADQTQVVTETAAAADLDTDLDDFFSVGQSGRAPDKGQFPALDNVNFETDEESPEAEKDAGKQEVDGGSGDVPETSVQTDTGEVDHDEGIKVDEESGQRLEIEGARRRSEIPGLEDTEETVSEFLVETVAYLSSEGAKGNGRIALIDSPSSPKDYPLNYQNYKVCRELKPGVKECLILETGEQFICITKSRSGSSEPPDNSTSDRGTRQSVFLVQQEGERRGRSGSNHSSSVADSGEVSQPLSMPTTRASVMTNAEAFAYVSFQDGTGRYDPNSLGTHLDESQQAYITENGIPVILDNAEDDVKIGLQAEIGRLAMGVQPVGSASPAVGTGTIVLARQGGQILREDVVEDVLSSGGERDTRPHRPSQEKQSKKSKRKKEKRDRFVELQPEIAADSAEDTATMSESDANVNNNNNNNNDQGVEGNFNENANSPHYKDELQERDTYTRPSRYTSNRPYHADTSDYAHSYDRYTSGSRGLDHSGLRSYAHSSSRGDSYIDSRGHRSREDSSYYRSGEPSSVDTSRLSTRYTHIERGDPRNSASKPESVTIPKFKTLKDQQVSWLEMFNMIEQQHRSELQSQYLEHQKILQEMQKNMEKELNKQQDTLRQRLSTHREMLEDLSPGRSNTRKTTEARNVNQSRTREEEVSSLDSQRSADHVLTDNTSHTTLQGVPVSLRNPPPISRYQQDVNEPKSSEDLPVKRSLEKEFSPTRPADTSLNLSKFTVGGDKQLRGGVYSSPMPLPKSKHKNSPRGSKSYEDTHRSSPRGESSRNSNSVHWAYDSQGQQEDRQDRNHSGSADVSLTESEEVLSPRTRISLREKHAKHLADLRAYYEEELREMRQLLSSKQERDVRGAGDSGAPHMTAGEKIMASENHELRQKYQQLQDAYHDAKIELRELQQKMQGLEIRASDYAERYDTAQSQVLTLRSRLEELTEFAKEKESLAADLEAKNKKSVDALQMAYKKEKELTESLHSAKTTIQRLVDKYETLEKDHSILKETASETQEKLYSSRSEVMEANNKLSRLELENKQLKHDNEILKHELTMAQSALNTRTSYEDAYRSTGSPDRGRSTYGSSQTARTRSVDRHYRSLSRERQDIQKESSPETETDSDSLRSPIMRAERELKKLQESQEFAPKLQRKFYGTEVPSLYGGPPITSNHTNNRTMSSTHPPKSSSPRDKKVRMSPQGRDVGSRVSAPATVSRTPTRGQNLRPNRESHIISDGRKGNERDYREREHGGSSRKSTGVENGLTSEQALERIRSGEIVSRPAWEDVYTSMAPARSGTQGGKGSPSNYTRDQMIRERLQNIENLERKYDDLTNEKRRYESALSKVPVQGHSREKDRLETELDRVDRELGSVRMSLKRFHVLKSTI